MPKYVYHCKVCEGDFETKHSIQKVSVICELCGKEGELERRPSTVFLTKKQSVFEQNSGIGDVLRATIEEAKHDMATEQEHLKKRVYKK